MVNTALRFISCCIYLATHPLCFIFVDTCDSASSNIYCTLHGRIKGTKCALFSVKCKGAVWKIKHSYEVNLFLVFAPQRIPEGDNCIFAYQHYTR